ncbi:MAG: hypothetical protein GC159_09665 [Phycisphaera sp.]|nr:hypothetical protein [Phycisphaera sp.]
MTKWSKIGVMALMVGLIICGCGQSQAQSGGTKAVVIDLDKVAKEKQYDKLIAMQINAANRELLKRRASIAQELQHRLNAEKALIGPNANSEQLAELQRRIQAANRAMSEINAKVNQVAAQVRAKLIVDFRDKVKPLAEKAAKKHGATIVLVNGADVLWFEDALDISMEVAAELEAAKLPEEPKDDAATEGDAKKDATPAPAPAPAKK